MIKKEFTKHKNNAILLNRNMTISAQTKNIGEIFFSKAGETKKK